MHSSEQIIKWNGREQGGSTLADLTLVSSTHIAATNALFIEALIKTRDACSIVDIIDCLLASTYVCVLRCSKSIDGLDGMGLDLGTDLSTALRC